MSKLRGQRKTKTDSDEGRLKRRDQNTNDPGLDVIPEKFLLQKISKTMG